MSTRPLIIIHGWNDDSRSFRKLAQLLEQNVQRSPKLINLADYITMDDDVTFDDIVAAMARAWEKERLPTEHHAVDVVAHSAGGLVVRTWLSRFYTAETAPIKHLVMLATPNFGSTLAHRGSAFYGRIIKGFSSKKMFNVGSKLLKAMELANPYAWHLAMQDRFGEQKFYGENKILCTVLIGNTGFSGIAAAANQEGSDGVVRVSAANLNCVFLNADFSFDPLKPTYTLHHSHGKTAFGVLSGENHSTIAAKENGPKNDLTIPTIVRGLQITDQEFSAWCEELRQMTQQAMQQGINDAYYHGFQNTWVFVKDQFDFHVTDYFLEFYAKNNSWFAQLFHGDVIRRVYAYSDDASYRSMLIDCTRLYAGLNKSLERMHISLTAVPELKARGNVVGYRTFTDEDIGSIELDRKDMERIFAENRTLLAQITLRREQADEVFRIKSL